ncbi:hypothetical protein ACH5RR_029480 [Cinchona calisaya]|uniref:Uncharacterized protein n=1 Tax=Cinchona calisaya TaxID=153742 RepID=A0ABD2YTC5_9GENT
MRIPSRGDQPRPLIKALRWPSQKGLIYASPLEGRPSLFFANGLPASKITRVARSSRMYSLKRFLLAFHLSGVTLRTSSESSPTKAITGPWICLTLKKHDKSLQYLIAEHQRREQVVQVASLVAQSQNLRGTWEPSPPTNPDYVFRRLRIEVGLCSLAVYHSSSLRAIYCKLDILAHHLHHVHSLNLSSWPPESDARQWHFGPPDDDEFGHGFEKVDKEFANTGNDDGVGLSGHS